MVVEELRRYCSISFVSLDKLIYEGKQKYEKIFHITDPPKNFHRKSLFRIILLSAYYYLKDTLIFR